jgi:hypothetical protein
MPTITLHEFEISTKTDGGSVTVRKDLDVISPFFRVAVFGETPEQARAKLDKMLELMQISGDLDIKMYY